jgi:tetratricopeptide (TPR) repeat protein
VKVNLLKCSFCGSDEEIDENAPICNECYDTFENDQIPSFDLREYFSGGLEKKLKEVDSLLFDLPENFFLWYLKGHLEHELGESKKAMRSINTSISYMDDFGDSWIRLGLIYSDLHREADARENFQRGLKFPLIDPSNLVDAGASLQASDQPKLAAKLLTRALELVSDDDRAMVTLAKVLVQTGDLDGAKKLMDRALNLYPHNEEVLRNMAQVMMRMGDLDSAMDMYSRILDQHPRDFEALLAKGEIHLKLGELTQSLKSYKAVRDLDIHISWPGILRFLISSLRNMLSLNKNQPSYRDDLKKEFENINLFLEELEGKVENAQTPDMLDDIESLIKVVENLRMNLKEQLGQFGELLKKYKVEDSFHKHLRTKVLDLHDYLDQMRYFDGKQISLELSPFLSDLKSIDTKMEGEMKEDIERRFRELEEVGLGNTELMARFEKISILEEEGNLEGATFMLKEIQIALEEYWNDSGRSFFNSKLKEMEELLEHGREQFDTSRLDRKLRSFKDKFSQGPKAVLDGYLEFARTYSEDSENFFKREVDNLIKEIDYKITILDKSSKETKGLKRSLAKMENRLKNDERPIDVHEELTELLKEVSDLELKQKASEIRERLMGLDKLLGEVDALGMDSEIAKNVEPVRRVIERSLTNENYRLADILTGEVYENVEKLLRENYMDELKESMYDSLSEIERFRKLTVTDESWDEMIDRVKGILEDEEATGPLIPVVSTLSLLQKNLQDFFIDRLPVETDTRMEAISKLMKEGEDFGFDLNWDRKVLDDIRARAEEISSLEILEEAVSLEAELERKIRDLLTSMIKDENTKVREKIDRLTEQGASQKDMMDILSNANRAEVLLESNSERDAFNSISVAKDAIEKLEKNMVERDAKNELDSIGHILGASAKLEFDTTGMEEELKALQEDQSMENSDRLEKSIQLKNKAVDLFNSHILNILEGYDGILEQMKADSGDILQKDEIGSIEDQISKLESSVREGEPERVIGLMVETGSMIDDLRKLARKRTLASRCSTVINSGIGMDDDRARNLVREAQDLAGRIEKGDTEQSEIDLDRIQKEMNHLRSLIQIQDVENMLSEIEELDDIFKEMVQEFDEDDYGERIDSISKTIKGLIDSIPLLYSSPDPEKVGQMRKSLERVREDIEYLDNVKRAKRKIIDLEEMGAFDIEIDDRLLAKDLKKLRELNIQENISKFSQIYQRVQGKMDYLKRLTSPVTSSSTPVQEDHGMEILVRAKGKRRSELGKQTGKKGGMLGISKLAKDMGEKRKLLEERPKKTEKGETKPTKEPVKEDTPIRIEKESEGEPVVENDFVETGSPEIQAPIEKEEEEVEEEKSISEDITKRALDISEKPKSTEESKEPEKGDLAGIAKLIAGDRIRKLEEGKGPSQEKTRRPEDKEGSLPWSKDRSMDVKGLSGMVDEMMDMEVQPQTSTPMKNAEKAKEKLESFYAKLPANLKLDESMALYARGLSHMQKGDHVGALRQFRLAISSAVKMTRLHTEITKAITSLDRELSMRRKKGEPNSRGEKLYIRAESALKAGNLTECATLIKEMKVEIFS